MLTAIREYAADVMAVRDRQGRTAVHHAAVTLSREDFEQVFGDFVRPHEGNKVNVPDADGWTPLHWAC
jgi:ankyrin repeat protein